MNIKLLFVGVCAHDQHEMTLHPRKDYIAKPTLPIGTVLEVIEEWENFYGTYYRCKTPHGMTKNATNPDYYDIPTYAAQKTERPPTIIISNPKPEYKRKKTPSELFKKLISQLLIK